MRSTAAALWLSLATSAVAAGGGSPRDSHWARLGLDGDETRFSPLTEINTRNVSRLGLAWSLDLPGEAGLEATPLEVDGVLYFPGSMGVVYAVDAASGTIKWTFDPGSGPKIDLYQRMMYAVNRGVAYVDHKIFVATRDGRMIAIDSATGAQRWSTRFLIEGDRSTSTGAPRIARGLVLIGNSGAEVNARGYVTALDAETGKLVCRFYVVPGDPAKPFEDESMAMAAKTWSGEWWTYGGGGTPWHAIVYDEQYDQVLIGTGNGSPYVGRLRGADKGMDNLFLCSIVAVDAKTGRYKWHYQLNPGEVWDYKATQDIILARLKIRGRFRQVLLQAPTNGFFYVIDRAHGKLLSAEKIGKVTWAERIDLKSGRPVERPGARYTDGPAIIYPGAIGAHNWQAMAFSRATGLVYIPYMQMGWKFWHSKEEEGMLPIRRPGFWNVGVMLEPYKDPRDPMDGRGALLAWDPIAQTVRWRQVHPTFWNGGVFATAGGLVFQGLTTGEFVAYDARGGQQLWSFEAQMGIIGAPISYSVNGKQFVSVLAGYGGGGPDGTAIDPTYWPYRAPRRLLTFALDGKRTLLKPEPSRALTPKDMVVDANLKADAKAISTGEYLYNFSCIVCHGLAAQSLGGAPDLRASPILGNRDAFRAILHENALVAKGMPRFDDLSDEDIDSLYQYIQSQARLFKERGAAAP